jgi:NADPH:quinone reductase-like Zn-dependent oxidoreductase
MLPSGAWAERVAVPTHALATLPDAVDFARAATLPIAGLTALYALAHGGLLLAKRVLITGASGGVGHLACQLAHAAGADVVALVRSEAKAGDALRGERSVTVVASEDGSGAVSHGPFDLILESVGGATLANVLRAIAEDGECVVFGTSAQGESTLDIRSFYGLGGAKLYGFILFHELQREPAGKGLARLVKLVERGVLRPHIDVERSWSELPRTAAQLWDREITGKAVLRFDG